jgi:hypothetical protein
MATIAAASQPKAVGATPTDRESIDEEYATVAFCLGRG